MTTTPRHARFPDGFEVPSFAVTSLSLGFEDKENLLEANANIEESIKPNEVLKKESKPFTEKAKLEEKSSVPMTPKMEKAKVDALKMPITPFVIDQPSTKSKEKAPGPRVAKRRTDKAPDATPLTSTKKTTKAEVPATPTVTAKQSRAEEPIPSTQITSSKRSKNESTERETKPAKARAEVPATPTVSKKSGKQEDDEEPPSTPAQKEQPKLSREQKKLFNSLILEARELEEAGALVDVLEKYKEAAAIYSTEKLQAKIKQYEEDLEPVVDSEYMYHISAERYLLKGGLGVPKQIFEQLFDYQKDGLRWFWSVHQQKEAPGGILADDMGLGKTIQTAAFLCALFDSKLVSHVLVVMPVSVVEHWREELAVKWKVGVRVRVFHGTSKSARQKELDSIAAKGGICLTTYGMILSNLENLSAVSWDYIILDEGHKIKNATSKISKACANLPSEHRIILSGTPVQNNLGEMWALFNWACKGKLLGSAKTFKSDFEEPIVRASHRKATLREKQYGEQIASRLREHIQPHFLRREKKEIFPTTPQTPRQQPKKKEKEKGNEEEENEEEEDEGEEVEAIPDTPKGGKMPGLMVRKNDFIVWVCISQMQQQLYESFLTTEDVKLVLNETKSPLAAIAVMKKICDHPMLLHKKMKTIRDIQLPSFEDLTALNDDEHSAELERIISQSGKLAFLVSLLANLKKEGHRPLIFSQSTKMLDIIQAVLTRKGYKMMRIDGTITSTVERQRRINLYNKDHSYFCFLLTTQVGGLGITLTSADRVVIFDPAWNSRDDQAVDRVYRLSQTRNVVVYRLITCGTIEEKIYRKQVFKVALMKTIEQKGNMYRYFTELELKVMFQLDDTKSSTTQQQLEALHAAQRVTDPDLDEHIDFLHSLGICGISDHDLLFTQDAKTVEACEAVIIAAKEAEEQLKISASTNVYSPKQYTPPKRSQKKLQKREEAAKAQRTKIVIDLEEEGGGAARPAQSTEELDDVTEALDRLNLKDSDASTNKKKRLLKRREREQDDEKEAKGGIFSDNEEDSSPTQPMKGIQSSYEQEEEEKGGGIFSDDEEDSSAVKPKENTEEDEGIIDLTQGVDTYGMQDCTEEIVEEDDEDEADDHVEDIEDKQIEEMTKGMQKLNVAEQDEEEHDIEALIVDEEKPVVELAIDSVDSKVEMQKEVASPEVVSEVPASAALEEAEEVPIDEPAAPSKNESVGIVVDIPSSDVADVHPTNDADMAGGNDETLDKDADTSMEELEDTKADEQIIPVDEESETIPMATVEKEKPQEKEATTNNVIVIESENEDEDEEEEDIPRRVKRKEKMEVKEQEEPKRGVRDDEAEEASEDFDGDEEEGEMDSEEEEVGEDIEFSEGEEEEDDDDGEDMKSFINDEPEDVAYDYVENDDDFLTNNGGHDNDDEEDGEEQVKGRKRLRKRKERKARRSRGRLSFEIQDIDEDGEEKESAEDEADSNEEEHDKKEEEEEDEEDEEIEEEIEERSTVQDKPTKVIEIDDTFEEARDEEDEDEEESDHQVSKPIVLNLESEEDSNDSQQSEDRESDKMETTKEEEETYDSESLSDASPIKRIQKKIEEVSEEDYYEEEKREEEQTEDRKTFAEATEQFLSIGRLESELSEEDIENYNNHIQWARECIEEGDEKEALYHLLEALDIYDEDMQLQLAVIKYGYKCSLLAK